MVEAELWTPRRLRERRAHPPRRRRPRRGELIQIDGWEHRWFEDRAPPCVLLVFVDDATGELMELRFAPAESTFSDFASVRRYLERHGRPVAFYSDKASIFRVNRPQHQGPGLTQLGRAMQELNIDVLCANTAPAKGRVERAHQTLQDRLVKELRLQGASTMAEGNTLLDAFRATCTGYPKNRRSCRGEELPNLRISSDWVGGAALLARRELVSVAGCVGERFTSSRPWSPLQSTSEVALLGPW
jgi:hypothetical protein